MRKLLRQRLGPVLAVLLLLAGGSPSPAEDALALAKEASVGIRAIRGFQGLFEWQPGSSDPAPDRMLGGPFESNGTVLDLAGIAAEAGVHPKVPLRPGDVYVVTTMRSVHNATAVWVRQVRPGVGPLPVPLEDEGTVVAGDGAMNLALVRFTVSPGPGAAPPRGLRWEEGRGVASGMPAVVVRFAGMDRAHEVYRDAVRGTGLVSGSDPFWYPGLPAFFLDHPIYLEWSGQPVVDEGSGRLVGIVAHSLRQSQRGGWGGPAYVIPAERIRSFVLGWLRGEPPAHGGFGGDEPALVAVGPELAALHGLAGPGGLVVMEDRNGAAGVPLLRRGDVLLRAGDRPLGAGGFPLGEVAFETAPGREVPVEGIREGKPFRTAIPVGALPGRTAEAVKWTEFAGAWFQDLAEVFRGPREERSGVVAVYVENGSPAQASGLSFRAVVQQVFSGTRLYRVATVADLERAVAEITEDPAYRGEIGLRVVDLRSPDASAGVHVLRWRPGEKGGTQR